MERETFCCLCVGRWEKVDDELEEPLIQEQAWKPWKVRLKQVLVLVQHSGEES